MNDKNPYAPPIAAVADHEPQVSLERPGIVALAVRLLWTGFAISFASSIYHLVRLPANAPKTIVVAATIFGLTVAAAISYVVFSAAWRGRNWARWLIGSLVLLTFGMVALLWNRYPSIEQIPWQTSAPFVIRMALYIAALAMLFSPAANAWYREKKRWL